MSAGVIAWMAAIQGLIVIAPDVIEFAAKVKRWITDMFSSGLITAGQQHTLNERVTDICRAALNGQVPEAWRVEPDPE